MAGVNLALGELPPRIEFPDPLDPIHDQIAAYDRIFEEARSHIEDPMILDAVYQASMRTFVMFKRKELLATYLPLVADSATRKKRTAKTDPVPPCARCCPTRA